MIAFAYLGICFVPLLLISVILLICVKELTVGKTLIAIVAGLISIIPITVIQHFVLNLPIFTSKTLVSVFVSAFIFNGLIEETLKMLFLFLLPGKKTSAGVFMAASIIAGLAIGSFETIIYMIAGTGQITVRFFTAMLIHTFCSGLSGLYVWSFKQKKTYVLPYISAVLLHGLYNFFAGFSGGFRVFAIITVVYAAIRLKFSYSHLTTKQIESNIPTDTTQGRAAGSSSGS